MTQCDRILRHMKDHGSITQAQAMAEYGCMRLAARIADLKRQGHPISVSTGHGKNRYGESTAFAVYRLASATVISTGAKRSGEIRPSTYHFKNMGIKPPQEVSADG